MKFPDLPGCITTGDTKSFYGHSRPFVRHTREGGNLLRLAPWLFCPKQGTPAYTGVTWKFSWKLT